MACSVYCYQGEEASSVLCHLPFRPPITDRVWKGLESLQLVPLALLSHCGCMNYASSTTYEESL